MTIKLIIFLMIGTILMGVPIALVSRKYCLGIWKSSVTTILLTVIGTIGTFVMYYIENGNFGGLSFYGAVFFVPIVFLPASVVLRISYGKLMDLCAIGECIMLALMKVHCILGGCCQGRVLYELDNGVLIRFPSREVEMIVAIILFVILFSCAMKSSSRGKLYAWYLLLYGGTRFALNFFRDVWQNWPGAIPIGTIWSIVAVVIGLGMLLIKKKALRQCR